MWRLLVLLLLAVGCVPPRPARLDKMDAPDPVEVDAQARLDARKCLPVLPMLYPGAGSWCNGRVAEGATLVGATTVDLGGAVGVALANPGSQGSGVGVPLISVQDAYIFAWVRPLMDKHLAQRRLYVPRDTFGEMVAAPFDGQVLKRPAVWAGTLGALGGAVAISALLQHESWAPQGGPVNWFGLDLPAGVGWPASLVTGGYLFEHVALAEEALYRGTLQSALARGVGPWGGWALGTLIFGASHIGNVLALPQDQWASYLAISVPYITLVGGALGLAYMDARYSLTASIAMHFWYDLLQSLATVLVDPQDGFFSARIGGAF